jgi:hypothetical protein
MDHATLAAASSRKVDIRFIASPNGGPVTILHRGWGGLARSIGRSEGLALESGARRDKADRNVALTTAELHNVEMGVGKVVIDFLERIAVGAGAVFALLVVIRLGLPRRSRIAARQRRTH